MSTPPPAPARTTSGWFALETDGVIHGWARDKEVPDDRLVVAVMVDGRRIATALCDRLVPSLLAQGESDGFSGFACAIPPALRDGRPHTIEVVVVSPRGHGTALKCKEPGFTLPAGSMPPHVTLIRGDGAGVEGVLAGPHVRQALDLWLGDRRMTADGWAPDWPWTEGRARAFRIDREGGVLALAADDARLVYPGTVEAGLSGAGVAALIGGIVRRTTGGGYRLRLDSRLHLQGGKSLAATATGADAPMDLTLRVTDSEAAFDLPVAAGRMALQLKDATGRPSGDPLPFDAGAPPCRWSNSDLSRWDANGPEGFEGSGLAHGFHAFPPALKAQLGLSGHLAVAMLPEAAGAVLLARPLAPAAGQGGRIGVRLFARADASVLLAWRVERDGETVDQRPFSLGPRWQLVEDEIALPADPRPLRLALVREEAGDPVRVAVAGLSADAPDATGFGDDAPAPSPPDNGNRVCNAALTRWPDGLAVEGRGTRVALAEGWALASPGTTSVCATAVPGDPEGHGLALRVPADTPPCALEVALDGDEVVGAGRLRFRARVGAGGPRHGLVDRIALVRRRAGGGDEALLAVIARKLPIGRDWDGYALAFLCRAGVERRFEGPGGGFELLLRFDFHAPVAIELCGLDLRLGREVPEASVPPSLAFEDPVIRAQLGTLKGLEGWRSTVPLRPRAEGAPPAPVAAEPRRWSWSAVPGTVEVGIPVHDAVDETLACLDALSGSTGVPHLVHLLDDGSGEDTRRRIGAFIADRPWMRLTVAETRGYTAAANHLVGASAADWVVLLNSDTIVTPGWLEGLLAAAAADDRTAMAGPVSNAASYQSVPDTHDGAGRWAVNPLPPGWTPADMARLVAQASDAAHPEVPLLNGFCTLIRRAAFAAVGGLDQAAFPRGYGEENDLCLRLAKAGWRLRVADDVYVWHAKSASFGHAARTELSKAGDRKLRTLHPDVDVAELGRRFLAVPALARLREAVRAALPVPVLPAAADR